MARCEFRRTIQRIGLAGLVWLGFTMPMQAQLLTTNGNFEAFTAGLPNAWPYTQGDGPATLQNFANTPFPSTFYGPGTQSIRFTDGAVAVQPFVLQSFATQTGVIYATWDFRLSGPLTGNYWTVQIDDSATVHTRFNMDQVGNFTCETPLGAISVLALNPNIWYQVILELNTATDTFSGTIQPFGGASTPFAGAYRISATSLNRIVLVDATAPQNAPIEFDNVAISLSPVPEPSTLALFGLVGASGSAIFWHRRRQKQLAAEVPSPLEGEG